MKQQKLPKINYNKQNLSALRTFGKRILQMWDGVETVPVTIKLLLKDIAAILDIIDKQLMDDPGSERTASVTESDSRRDKAYNLLISKIRVACKELDDHIADAGERLTNTVEKYPATITSLPYSEQTDTTALALKEFRSEENIADITTLDLARYLDMIEEFNNDFEKKYRERTSFENSKEDLPNLRPIRRELSSYLRRFCDIVTYLYSHNHPSVSHEMFSFFETELINMGAISKKRETILSDSDEA